ncbi:MAG: UvrD-helicase domain-containing protein [Myxococcota bacterium]
MGLNPQQQAAVDHRRGPLLVLAGAGSGKTRVITLRIAALLESGVQPGRILAVSFTNKASAEMQERMAKIVGPRITEKLWLSTFHSFGVRFLRQENRALGYDGRFVIFDQGDALGLVREILRDEQILDRSIDLHAILTRISLWKNAFKLPKDIAPSDFEYDAVARAVYPIYEERLAAMHAVDFDDLVVAPVKILKGREELRSKWRAKFHYLLIDEFQDTNRSQLELVRLLATEHNDVCVVGDDDQSIYSWRGADVGNILDFERHFPGARVVKLETNYRSRKPILDVANAVIARSRAKRHGKTLRSHKGEGAKVRVVTTPDGANEAKFVVSEIRNLAKGGEASPGQRPIRYGDMAVLYRSNGQARILEEELRIGGIPYRLFGGTQFFDRKEVKDAIAYLRVVENPRDELSLRRIINTPTRGIGDTTLKKLTSQSTLTGKGLYRVLLNADGLDLPASAKRGAQILGSAIETARASLRSGINVFQVTQTLLAESGFTRALQEDRTPHGKRRRENIAYLMKSIQRFAEDHRAEKPTLGQFLTRITLRVEQEEEDAGNRVTLSSLHSSKGLEFGVVFFIGCNEGTIPHKRTIDPSITEAVVTDVDEERRLFYVGVTRAQELLYLSRPLQRTTRGRVTPCFPTRFLEGLPDDAWETYQPIGNAMASADEASNAAEAILAMLRGS